MPRPQPPRSRWLRHSVALGLLIALSSCAAPTMAPLAVPPLPARTPSAATVAGQVSVVGQRGTLDHGEREKLIQRVAAQGSAELMKRQLAAMSSFGEVDLHAGNEARLLIDGPATFAAMFDAIGKARRSVLLESYIIEDAAIARQLAALLARKRAEGVAVLVIYDAVGSIGTQQAFFDELEHAGIATCSFNPINPLHRVGYFDITHRDHRKILVVDREIGFTGGINISAVYSSGSFGRKGRLSGGSSGSNKSDDTARNGWRDTQLQLRGPAVGALEDLVRETWQAQGCKGEMPAPPTPQAAKPPAGQQLMRIVPSTPDDRLNRIYAMLLAAIGAAEQSVHLTMAYFAPGTEMVDALCKAAQRGVDVQLILPSRSDFAPVLHAGRSHYKRLLRAGVQIHELQDAVLHAKTAVIDGVVSTVGSSNMDWRSFTANNEVNAVVIGEAFGGAMARMFEQDLAASQPVTAEAWAERPLLQRGKEFFARLFERWW